MKTFGDDEVVHGAAVRLLNQLQRLDQRDLDILLLDQRRERLGGDFREVREGERAFLCGEGGSDLDGIRGFDGDDGGEVAIPCVESGERLGGVSVERGQAVEVQWCVFNGWYDCQAR